MTHRRKFHRKSAGYRTPTHMTDPMTHPHTTSHTSLKPQVFSGVLTTWCDPQRSVLPWSAWRRRCALWKTCCFVTHPEPQISSTLIRKMGQEVPKTKKKAPCLIFFDDRVADGRKHSAKMRVLEISKNTHFYDVSFSLGKKHILQLRCVKQHAFLVHPPGVS